MTDETALPLKQPKEPVDTESLLEWRKKPVLDRFNFSKKKTSVDLTELGIYLNTTYNTPPDEVLKRSDDAAQQLADIWDKANPKGPKETTEFYRTTDGYLYDLFVWTHDRGMWELFDEVFTGKERVLDYGCGIGDAAIYLAQMGCDVIATDLKDSKTLAFAMWRTYQRGLGDKIQFEFYPDKDKFDAVICIDVLEHLYFPLRYIIKLCSLLKDQKSFFFFTPTFSNDVGKHPMHLKENFWLNENYTNVMQGLAFNYHQIVKDYLPIWRPVFGDPAELEQV